MVVVSISIGGGFFGFMGMFLGVPTFAVISYLFRCFIHYRLRKKGLPAEHENYIDLTAVDDTSGELHYCTPATASLSGTAETYTKPYKTSVPVTASFSDTVHDNEQRLNTKTPRSKKEKPDKKKDKKQSDSNTHTE